MDTTGEHGAAGFRIAVAASRFNEDIVSGLVAGAFAAFEEAGLDARQQAVVWVPGAFELPITAQRLAESGRFDAVVCLGCLIKGDTMHFEYIAESVVHGLARVALESGVPVAFGVLTTLTEEQARARAVAGPDNKGAEAARAALEMASVLKGLDAQAVS